MKTVLVILVISVATVLSKMTIERALQEWRKEVAPTLSKCLCRTGARASTVESFFEFGDLPDDPCFKCTISCWSLEIGLISPIGTLNATRMAALYGMTDEIAQKCGYAFPDVDLCERLYKMLTCNYNSVKERLAALPENDLLHNDPLPLPQQQTPQISDHWAHLYGK